MGSRKRSEGPCPTSLGGLGAGAREAGEQIRHLALRNFSFPDAAIMLDYFPQVDSLRILVPTASSAYSIGLAAALAKCHLTLLELDIKPPLGTGGADPRWTTDDWLSIGGLRSLKLGLETLTERDWTCIERSADSLEMLELRFTTLGGDEAGEEDTQVSSFCTTFPCLHTLLLRANVRRQSPSSPSSRPRRRSNPSTLSCTMTARTP